MEDDQDLMSDIISKSAQHDQDLMSTTRKTGKFDRKNRSNLVKFDRPRSNLAKFDRFMSVSHNVVEFSKIGQN